MVFFPDRRQAGRELATRLEKLRGRDVVVLCLPRGGVPVGFEVAQALGALLDVIVVRKLGYPAQPELAMGAIGEGGIRMLDANLRARYGVRDDEIRRVEQREQRVLDERVNDIRRGRPRIDLDGRIAVIVDDGIATGFTARAACEVARRLGASKVVLAVPVCPAETRIPEADEVVSVHAPRRFVAVSQHYRDFRPTTDEEVMALLDEAAHPPAGTDPDPELG
ncbi:MAG TPA: phosphoribosyltransferase family protein [Propionibacteriaceae bacterium]|nr:phosphoribosyltransferase family protein [Propionibacteriaceae bacterium]